MDAKSLNELPYIFDDQKYNLIYFVLFLYLCRENIESNTFISFVNYCIKEDWNIGLYINKFMQLCKIYSSKKGIKSIEEYLVNYINS